MAVRLLTKEQMVERLRTLCAEGWIKSSRPLNAGGIGNTVDALLGFPENNLPIADTAQWELKTHRVGSSSLLTLFHMEPEPRDAKVVVTLLMPRYGWPLQAGRTDELSFRQTLRAAEATDRGFLIFVDRKKERISVHFEPGLVGARHIRWLQTVAERDGLSPLNPQPFWSFQELFLKASTKMLNSFYLEVETRRANKDEYFRIRNILILQSFDLDRFIEAIEKGAVLVDFDARTYHNHGTKFRVRQNWAPRLYRYTEQVV